MDEKTRSEFEEHIAVCETCRNELDDISKTVELLRSIPQVELPAYFKEELHEKLVKAKEEEQKNRKGLFFIKNNYFKAVSTIAAGAFVIFALRGLFFNSFTAKKSMDMGSDDAAKTEAAIMEKAPENTEAGGQLADSNQAYTDEGTTQTDGILSMRSFNAAGNADMNSDNQAAAKENKSYEANTAEENDLMLPDRDMTEKVDRGESKGFGITSSGIQPRQQIADFTGDTFLQNAAVRVKINIYDDTAKTQVIEGIIENCETWNKTITDSNQNEDDNISIIEFNIRGLDYKSLTGKLKTEIEALNLIVECNSPILIDEFRLKYDEYLIQLKEIKSQLSALSEDKDNSNSSKKAKAKDDEKNIEISIKALLDEYDHIAEAEVHIKAQ